MVWEDVGAFPAYSRLLRLRLSSRADDRGCEREYRYHMWQVDRGDKLPLGE